MKICEDICDIHHSKSVCVKAHVGSNPTLSGLESPQPRMVAGFLMRHREVGFFDQNLPVAENPWWNSSTTSYRNNGIIWYLIRQRFASLLGMC